MRTILSVVALFAWSGCALAQTYAVTELEPVNGTVAFGEGANTAGQVVGWSSSTQLNYATLWNGNTPTVLSALVGSGGGGIAYSVNNAGQTVGGSAVTSGLNFGHATLWTGTTPIDLGTLPGGNESLAFSVNKTGQAVGYAYNGQQYIVRDISRPVFHATIFSGGTVTDLGTLGGPTSQANGINDAGQIVGIADTTGTSTDPATIGDPISHATLWNGSTATDLGTLGGTSSFAYKISNTGQVVGFSDTTGNVGSHATIWNGTKATDLGTLGGNFSQAESINSAGQVVGISSTTGDTASHATLWANGRIIDLNSELSPALAQYVTLIDAVVINDNGSIVVDGVDSRLGTSENSIFVLTPNSPASQLAALLTEVTGVGPGDSLADKVALAQTYYAIPNVPATCSILTDFVSEVKAQSGKKIDQQLGAKLIADADAIEVAIGCN